jgi:hypothetical protein
MSARQLADDWAAEQGDPNRTSTASTRAVLRRLEAAGLVELELRPADDARIQLHARLKG